MHFWDKRCQNCQNWGFLEAFLVRPGIGQVLTKKGFKESQILTVLAANFEPKIEAKGGLGDTGAKVRGFGDFWQKSGEEKVQLDRPMGN